MKEFAQIIKDYRELSEQLKDSRNYFCFDTKNGKRLIIKVEGRSRCTAIDANFRAVSFLDDEEFTFYDSPLHLIESYFYTGDVGIDDILITTDKGEALYYLMGKEI